jgi:hypothetical protein
VASSPRTGSYVLVGSDAEDMNVQEIRDKPLRIEDLEDRDGGLHPTDMDGSNREETVLLDSSVHSHNGEESDSSRQVEGDSESNSKKKKKKRKKKSKEGKQQLETTARQESESRNDSSATSRCQPSAQNLCRFFEDLFTRNVLYPGQFVNGSPPETQAAALVCAGLGSPPRGRGKYQLDRPGIQRQTGQRQEARAPLEPSRGSDDQPWPPLLPSLGPRSYRTGVEASQ